MKFSKKIYSTPAYKQWRTSIFERDSFTCRLCLRTDCYIEAHHIKPKSLYPNLLYEKKNGITLCGSGRWSCHKRVTGQELLWAPLLQKILKEEIWDHKQIVQLILEFNSNNKALVKSLATNGRKKKRKFKRKVRKLKNASKKRVFRDD